MSIDIEIIAEFSKCPDVDVRYAIFQHVVKESRSGDVELFSNDISILLGLFYQLPEILMKINHFMRMSAFLKIARGLDHPEKNCHEFYNGEFGWVRFLVFSPYPSL